MAFIFHEPLDRRNFLRVAAAGIATVAAGGGRAALGQADGGDSLRLALLSDTHIPGDRVNGHRGFNPWENLRRIVPDVAATKPEATLLCGDAARLEGQTADYQELKALLAPVAAVSPICIGMGNHDDRANFRQVFGPRAADAPQAGDRQIVALEYPLMRVVMLDSLLYVNRVAGLLGKDQREWLDRYLEEKADRPVALFVHHTLEDRDGDLLDSDRFFSLLRPHRHVKAVFHGHSHEWNQRERDGVQVVNLPAVGYNFRDSEPVGWVDARFNRQGVDLTLRAIGGNTEGDGKTVAVRWS